MYADGRVLGQPDQQLVGHFAGHAGHLDDFDFEVRIGVLASTIFQLVAPGVRDLQLAFGALADVDRAQVDRAGLRARRRRE